MTIIPFVDFAAAGVYETPHKHQEVMRRELF